MASTIFMAYTDLEALLIELKKTLFWDYNIKHWKLHRWSGTSFESFRHSRQSIHKAASAYVQFLVANHKQLLFFMKSYPCILENLWSVFRNEQWYQTLFEQFILAIYSNRFAGIFKTTPSNYDKRQSRSIKLQRPRYRTNNYNKKILFQTF